MTTQQIQSESDRKRSTMSSWFRIFRRFSANDLRIGRTHLHLRGDDTSEAMKELVPKLLNAIGTVPALANELQKAEAKWSGEIAALKDGLAKVEQSASEIGQRLEFVRNEIMGETRQGSAERRGSPIQEARVLHQDKLTAVPLRLNLGCGDKPLDQFVNIDRRELPGVDVVASINALPFAPRSIDEIFSAHVLEHFPQEQLRQVLPYWKDLLKPAGKFRAVVSDGRAMLNALAAGHISFEDYRKVLFGTQEYEGGFRYNLFEPDSLSRLLEDFGFRNIHVLAEGRRNGLRYEFEIEATA